MITRFCASMLVAAVLLAGGAGAAVGEAPVGPTTRPIQRFERLVFRGDSALSKLSALGAATVAAAQDVRQKRGLRAIDIHPSARRRPPVSTGAPIPVPFAPSRPVVPADADFFGFRGLTDVDQFSAGSAEYANTQFDSEPPDLGLCVGNGFAVEAVNNAVAVYSILGTPLSAPTALNQFFELAPEFSSFPKLLYEAQWRSTPIRPPAMLSTPLIPPVRLQMAVRVSPTNRCWAPMRMGFT